MYELAGGLEGQKENNNCNVFTHVDHMVHAATVHPHDVGNQLIGYVQELFVDLFVVAGVIVPVIQIIISYIQLIYIYSYKNYLNCIRTYIKIINTSIII